MTNEKTAAIAVLTGGAVLLAWLYANRNSDPVVDSSGTTGLSIPAAMGSGGNDVPMITYNFGDTDLPTYPTPTIDNYPGSQQGPGLLNTIANAVGASSGCGCGGGNGGGPDYGSPTAPTPRTFFPYPDTPLPAAPTLPSVPQNAGGYTFTENNPAGISGPYYDPNVKAESPWHDALVNIKVGLARFANIFAT